ncbi:hypothetical protein [Enterococcus sp. AZ102]|uniref:hypothetical protein n=1 Tax=Enterococcus sp. AZ102 TaxID=2774865 RepID=UPI003F28F2AA
MSYNDDLKILVQEIKDRKFNESNSLSHLDREDVIDMIFSAEQEGFISRRNSKDKIVQQFMGGDFMLNRSTYVTRSGMEFLEGYDRNKVQSPISNQFNGSITGLSIGDNNKNTTTINNNYGYTIKDLKDLLSTLNESDKEIGNDLIKTLEIEEAKPGYLKRFDTFLQSYPKIAEVTGKIALGILTNLPTL